MIGILPGGRLAFKSPKAQDDAYMNGDFSYHYSLHSLDVGGHDISLRATMLGALQEINSRHILQ
jgi:hypothetical protein